MDKIIQNWILLGAVGVALAMGLASFMAGVSFYHVVLRVLAGASAFLIVGGVVGGMISRSLLKRMAVLDREAARAADAADKEEAAKKAA